jgi:hypothetical protein
VLGADTFVLRYDESTDTITDFTPARIGSTSGLAQSAQHDPTVFHLAPTGVRIAYERRAYSEQVADQSP